MRIQHNRTALHFGIGVLCGVLFVGMPVLVFAAEGIPLEVGIGSTFRVTGLVDYIIVAYEFLVGIVGVVAAVMIMFNGLKWAGAAGNAEKVGESKQGLIDALVGLAIALISFTILNTINPALTTFEDITFEAPNVQLREGDTAVTTDGEIDVDQVWPYSYCVESGILNNAGDGACTGVVALDTQHTQAVISKSALQLLPAEAARWNQLAADFHTQFGIPVPVTHAFRSVAYQKCLYDNPDETGAVSPALPCTSSHNGGAAIDVSTSSLTQEQYNYLACGKSTTCAFQESTTTSGRVVNNTGFNSFGWKFLNYNPDLKTGDTLWEQHHMDFNNGTSASAEVCTACPTSGCPGCQ